MLIEKLEGTLILLRRNNGEKKDDSLIVISSEKSFKNILNYIRDCIEIEVNRD